ncbi:hypothetical protein IIA28_17180, partial [candidate division KSB1 bacterium]|nr:hypothetical protein [candidate division KSB1 bacterium]
MAIVSIFVFCIEVFSQNSSPIEINTDGLAPVLEFERLSVEHGLSQSTVNGILQDREGYMWFGTLNGLNKYDGYRFVDFRHNPNDPNSISSDQICALYEDNKGNLWVGTLEGLNRFDPANDRFVVYKYDLGDPRSLSNNLVLAIHEDRSGFLWIGTSNGLNRFNEKRNNFRRYHWSPNDSISLSHNSVSAIFEDKDGNLWVGTNGGGLNKFDPDRTSITHYIPMGRRASLTYTPTVIEAVSSLVNSGRTVSSILGTGNLQNISQEFELREQSDILLVSVGEGTDKMYDFGWLERDGKKIWAMELDRTKHAGGHPKNRIQLEVMTLDEGKYTLAYKSDDSHSYKNWNRLPPQNRGLWGVQAIPISADEAGFFRRHLKKYVKPSAPSSNRISSITQDDEGTLWIGTHGGGLNKLEFGTDDGFVAGAELDTSSELGFPRFSVYRTSDPELRKIYSEEVFNFIDTLNQKKRRIEAILKAGDFRRDESNFEIPEHSQVLVVAMAEGGKVMNDTALLMRDKKVIWEMKPEKTYHAGGAFKNRIQIEVLALTSGAYKLQFRSDDLHSFDNWNDLPPTYPDLWGVQIFRLSTSEANRIENVLKKHTFSNTIASNGVRAVKVDENGDLWIATFAGLSRLDRSTGLFTNFKNDPKNPASLSVNEVQTVYQDKSGTLWIGTVLGGINKLNRHKNRFPKYTANPFVKNSLQNRIVYSFHEDREGLIWVGTRTGLNLFDPGNKEFFNFETSPVLAELQK